eukprot:sb/3461631/
MILFVFGLLLARVVEGDISLAECKPTEVNGYLLEHCPSPDDSTYRYFFKFLLEVKKYFKCPRSNVTYFIKYYYRGCNVGFSTACPSDPGFYQACGYSGCTGSRELAGTTLLCGTFICDGQTATNRFYRHKYRCNSGTCGNTELNMVGCNNINNSHVITKCNNICEDFFCSDESDCNGVQYGLWCKGRYVEELYIPPYRLCNGYPSCDNGEDEIEECFNLTVTDHTTCQNGINSEPIKIQDNMRCFHPGRSYCLNRQDQTNCSDPERVVMQCLSQGCPTTISKWGYCLGYTLCDDGYNNACVDPELGCNIHKGQLCDGHLDCNEGRDESCKDLTNVTCIRRFHSPDVEKNVSLPILLEWVMDGEVDCLDGMDEDEEKWLKCGTDYYTRYQELETECTEVLLCPLEKNYIDLNNLCDRINTCSFEEKLCNAARETDIDVTNLIDTFFIHQDEHYIQHCFPTRAADLERQLGKCNTVEHTAGFVKTVLNVQQPVFVKIPETKVDCSHLFGANYVYAACNNICLNAECPLKKIPGDTCINKKDSVVRALADTVIPSTTTLFKTTKDPGFYDNKIFPCDNKRCVSYRDVCNLKDDCNDGSDEKFCANHFQCNNSKMLELVALSQVCDDVVHCSDFSDECLQNCPSTNNIYIFGNIFLRSASLSMGLISTSLNTISLVRSASDLPQQKAYEMFLNKSSIVLINLGDLMIGVYLLLLSYFDFIYNAEGNYCQEKYQWFSSSECSFLGVLSTTGSQLSLFAMTILSITRLANIGNLVQRDLFSYKSVAKLVLLLSFPLLASVIIAVTPILSFTEDYFVNGLYYYYYYGSPLFIRPVSKINHYTVFKEYFEGRSMSWEKASFSWEAIRSTVKEIFSSDHGGNQKVCLCNPMPPIFSNYMCRKIESSHGRKSIPNSTVLFYGNDGVCVFKYLVTRDDPQWVFSTSILLVNFLCFIFILVSYVYISFKTHQSGRNVGAATGRQGANRALQAKSLYLS